MARVLTFVCEGETAARRHGRFPGEDAITASSRRAAEMLGPLLQGLDEALSGPQMASRETAAILRLDAATEPRLSDLDHGRWTGRRIRDVAEEDADRFRAWLGGAAPPGGEALCDLFGRVDGWLNARLEQRGRAVVVVSPNVLRAAILIGLRAPPQSFSRLDVLPLHISELTSDGRTWRLRSINVRSRAG